MTNNQDLKYPSLFDQSFQKPLFSTLYCFFLCRKFAKINELVAKSSNKLVLLFLLTIYCLHFDRQNCKN